MMDNFFKSILDAESTIDTSIDFKTSLFVVSAAFAVGIIASAAYMLASGKRGAFCVRIVPCHVSSFSN